MEKGISNAEITFNVMHMWLITALQFCNKNMQ